MSKQGEQAHGWNIEQILVYVWQMLSEGQEPYEYPYERFATSEGGKQLRLELAALAAAPSPSPSDAMGYCDRHRWLHAKDVGPSLPPFEFPCENWAVAGEYRAPTVAPSPSGEPQAYDKGWNDAIEAAQRLRAYTEPPKELDWLALRRPAAPRADTGAQRLQAAYESGCDRSELTAVSSSAPAAPRDGNEPEELREALRKLRDAPLAKYIAPIESGDYHYNTQDDMSTAMGMGRDIANGIFDAVESLLEVALSRTPSEPAGQGLREAFAIARARLDEATKWHQFGLPDHDEDEWCCRREQQLRDEVMSIQVAMPAGDVSAQAEEGRK